MVAIIRPYICSPWDTYHRQRRGINIAPLVKEGVTGKEEIAIAMENKEEYETFKAAVLPKLKVDWMKKDVALVKYFNAAGKISADAVALMEAVLAWRKDNNIDTILEDETVKKNLPLFGNPGIRGKDLMGRLVFYEYYGIWKFNEAIQNGTESAYEKTLHYSHEKSARDVIMAYESGETAYSRIIPVLDFENFQMIEWICPACTPIVVRIAQSFDKMYPQAAHRWMIIRAPMDFDLFLDIIRVVISRETNENINHYGRERTIWEPELRKLIDGELIDKMISKDLVDNGFQFPGVQNVWGHPGK